MRRSLQTAKLCRQIQSVELNIKVDGTAGTPSASGMDAAIVESVTDVGTGNYIVKIKDKSHQNLVVNGVVPMTAGVIPQIVSESQDEIELQFVDSAGAPIDSDFGLSFLWLGTKHLF